MTGWPEQREKMFENMPSVIDKKMLTDAILDQFPKSIEERKILCEEGIDFTKITVLQLECKSILTIEYLWPLINLKELILSDNLIEEIEGLDLLVHLIRLDLSFNNIEDIKGLDKLEKLEDLSLFANKIIKLKNMEKLVNLQLFSVGNNLLCDFNNVLYLKQFKKLRCLNLEENPISKENFFELHTIAVLPNLMYLNYSLVTEEKKSLSKGIFHLEYEEALNEIYDNEQQEIKEKEQKQITDYYKVFSDVKTQGLEFPGLTDMKKELYVEYKAKLKNLVDTLMKLEMDVIEQVEEFNRIFKYAISEIINKYIQRIQKLQTILRDYEQQFSEQFEEFCRTCIEHFDKQRLVNVEEDMEIFLISPQKLQSLARECHDRRLTIINKREKITIERLRDWLNDITSRIYSEEIDRNRKRINEIICFKDYYEKEGYSFLFIGDEETDYDDDEKSSSSSVNGN
ncbi:dynein regulatory complex subunit 3-like isoform X3 [Centruroides sculpturatus]|uniref:dynein regulatory complex subunit 3-like isoform X3 n=1 Tax=Centruroides sculpturatus TaxID=218467 RepID=UPI000C6EBEE8|nr:dynein regulatory complex subunit 3-like isoform X3 [Centruroides sculpturatus]